MIERDYIMRMIQMLTGALAKVMFRKNLHQYEEALDEIDEASEHLIGMKWTFLRSFSDEQLAELFGSSDRKDKLIVAAELLRAESEILFEQWKQEEACSSGMKAVSLFARLIIEEKGYLDVMQADKFISLLHRLDEYHLPAPINRRLVQLHEVMGDFAAAEKVLMNVIDEDPAFAGEGIAFYRRMLEKKDEELCKGGLVREKAAERLAKLATVSSGMQGPG